MWLFFQQNEITEKLSAKIAALQESEMKNQQLENNIKENKETIKSLEKQVCLIKTFRSHVFR